MYCVFVTVFLNGGFLWSGEAAWTDHTILKPGIKQQIWREAAVFNIYAVPLNWNMCHEHLQNPCYWYIHQSCPDNRRSCHSTIQWPIFFYKVVYFLQHKYLTKYPSQVSEDKSFNHSCLLSSSSSACWFPQGLGSPASLFSPSFPSGHRRICEAHPPAWRWSFGRSQSADADGAAFASGSPVHVCGESVGSLPVLHRKWCCSGRGVRSPALNSLLPWSVHLDGEEEKEKERRLKK